MALIDCPECRRKVSNKAKACPHCGFPVIEALRECPECREGVPAEIPACPHCGYLLAGEEPEEPPGPVTVPTSLKDATAGLERALARLSTVDLEERARTPVRPSGRPLGRKRWRAR